MKPAPAFELLDQHGQTHRLNDFAGKWVVVYFYPKDATPGCTTEACNFRDARNLIAELGNAVVVGISKDSVKAHKKFADKYNLNFTLLADPEHTTIQAYGAWKQKKFMGREYMGIERSTVIIDPRGMIAKEYPKVDPNVHAAEIITDLKTLQATLT